MLLRFPSCSKQIKHTISLLGSYTNSMLSEKKVWIPLGKVSDHITYTHFWIWVQETFCPPSTWGLLGRPGVGHVLMGERRGQRLSGRGQIDLKTLCEIHAEWKCKSFAGWGFCFSFLLYLDPGSFTHCHYDCWPLEAIPGCLNYNPGHLTSLSRVLVIGTVLI